MNILAIDTSTEACSAALLREDGQVFSEFEIAPRQHTHLLPEMMDKVLSAAACSKSEIGYCAFANGPGAFTGIRIAASTAQGIGIALKIPLIQISTLATLAQVSIDRQAADTTMVALDARMEEVYWAIYRKDKDGLASLAGAERLDKLSDVVFDGSISHGAGHGWQVGKNLWQHHKIILDEDLLPDAQSMLKLAKQAVEMDEYYPADKVSINYLRNQVAEKSRKA